MLLIVAFVAAARPGTSRAQWLSFGLRLQFVFFAVLAPLLAGEMIKWVAGRGRPFVGAGAEPFNFVPFAGTEAYASFPSAHAITAFALAFAVSAVWPRAWAAMIVYALLIAATSLTLVLRLLGTDHLVSDWITGIPGGEVVVVAIVLGAIGLSAFVLDAFEIIFVIVPIAVPPLLIRVADARWISVLVLLTLQTSFLLPPFGYALMMARGTLRQNWNCETLVSAHSVSM